MKICLAAYILMFCMASSAQTAVHSGAADAQSLIAKSRAVLEAEKAKDAAALNNLLADDFRSVDMAGDSGSRNEMLGTAKEGFLKDFIFYSPQALRIDDDSMLVSYNSAITLSDTATKELAEDNLTYPRYFKVSDLWVRQGGEWKLKFEQSTPLRVMY
ncbi:MAG TPA: nuclear transport factor 2 family protein [Terriglobales bacterium]|nr:nuclear transport factor 2 family protein [Terriglobales bacterium]